MSDAEKPRSRSGLLFLVGLVAGALAVFLLLRTAPAPPPQVSKTERIAIIRIDLDGAGHVTHVYDPETDDPESGGKELAVSRSEGHFAHWMVHPPSANVKLTIEMKAGNESPFEGPFVTRGNQVFSGRTRADAPYNKPQYKVNVYDNTNNSNHPLDPVIRVVP